SAICRRCGASGPTSCSWQSRARVCVREPSPVSLSPVETESGDGDIVAEINVTPLTDICLVLLIIFMVTSTALTQQGTKVNLPRAGAGGAEPSGVMITATADHRIELNGKALALDDLK